MTATMTIGNEQLALDIANYHHTGDDTRNGWGYLTRGDHRAIYVDYDTDTVYKIGRDAANRREHEALTNARLGGCDFAPATALYELTVTVPARWGCDSYDIDCTVIAMPYLPDDGSVDHAEATFEFLALAGDFNLDNIVAHDGKLWLIDAGGML